MNSGLGWKTVFKIAWRDLRAARAKFLFVIAAVAAGVGSLAGVRGFSQSFHTLLLKEARTLIAADVAVRSFQPATPQQLSLVASLDRRGLEHTEITETLSMASSTAVNVPLMVSVKAVDPALYPFYGSVRLDPSGPLGEALQSDTVAVSSDLLVRLKARPGDLVHLGRERFRISAVVVAEPDRMAGSLNVGPRLLLSREALERTGLMQPGSRASHRILFRLGPGAPGVEQVRKILQKAFPEAEVSDSSQTNPAITRGLRRATRFLSLVSLIALIVGALGVAGALRTHLEQRMETIAIMKCIGARSGQILRIYLAQALGLGLAGSLLGVAVGFAVEHAFPPLIARYFSLRPDLGFTPGPAVHAIAVGVLVTVLFTLPPLLALRRVRPGAIFRREMAEEKPCWRKRLAGSRPSLAAGAILVAGIAVIAAQLSDSLEMGALFAGALVVSLLVLSGTAWLLLRAARGFLRVASERLPVVARHGLANLYRPGTHATAVLVALGIGVTFTLTVYLVERSIVARIESGAPRRMPNVVLINITPRERDGVLELLRAQHGVEGAPELVPLVSARLETVDGVPVKRMALHGPVRRYLRTRQLTWAAARPAQVEIERGSWWDPAVANPKDASVSVAAEAAEILGIRTGTRLEWSAAGRLITARVASIHHAASLLGAAREFILSPGALDGLPTTYFSALRMRPRDVPALQRAAYDRFPTVTVINAADVLEIVQKVVEQIALVVRFISAFAILAGVIVLASSVAGTRFRRIREVAILKTLGAARRRVAGIFSLEFLLLGAMAGLMGSLLATAFSALLLERLWHVEARFDPLANVVAILLAALGAVAAGWLASLRILGQKPLEVLREE